MMSWKTFLCAWMLMGAAFGEGWEVGAIGGFGYSPSLDVKRQNDGTASTGVKNGAVAGAYGGEDMYRYFSGEARYLYRFSDLKVSSGGVETSFGGHTHIITGDILGHFRPTGARFRPFIAFGGGVKV